LLGEAEDCFDGLPDRDLDGDTPELFNRLLEGLLLGEAEGCLASNTPLYQLQHQGTYKSIRLDSIVSIPHWLNFPFILYFILRPQPYSSRNISGSNRGLQGDVKKSNCSIATNPTPAYVQNVLNGIEFFLIPHRLNFPFYSISYYGNDPIHHTTSLDPTGV
jgi:hypothetical protein